MSQQRQIILRMREMIMTGALKAGERVTEVRLAESLGVSRTPVRHALSVLAQEGLLVPAEVGRGFVVRAFSEKDIRDAILLRGILEGTAARLVAEKGLDLETSTILQACVKRGEAIFAKGMLHPGDGIEWSEINELFHSTLVTAAGNTALAQALAVNDRIPFASAGAFFDDAKNISVLAQQFNVLRRAQQQHEIVLAGLLGREGARVEALMREHAYAAIENIALFRAPRPTAASELEVQDQFPGRHP